MEHFFIMVVAKDLKPIHIYRIRVVILHKSHIVKFLRNYLQMWICCIIDKLFN